MKFITILLAIGVLFIAAGATLFTVKTKADDHAAGSPILFNASERNKNAGYPFSDSVEVDGWVFLSGKLGIIPGTSTLAEGGIEGEARQAMENIKASLAATGLGMDRIVKCLVMIDDMADWPAFNGVYKEYFPSGNFPARSAFGAEALAIDARVEVECLARR